ncbi:IclR family transcriptional regulator domain-containing protein [Streptomyces sp. NPDC002920]
MTSEQPHIEPEQETQATSRSGESLQSLERGIAVLQVFSREHPALTLSDVAKLTGITRATVRRILLTLEELGHVRSDGRLFSLTPRVLNLGWSYLSSLNLEEIAQPLMRDVVRELDESCSMATLDAPDIVYVARVHTRHVMTISGGVGTRLPAHATALGHVLLAGLPPRELDDYLAAEPLQPYTSHTITETDTFRDALGEVAEQGWALVDQELELGLRAIAAPITGRTGRPLAALSISSASARTSLSDLRNRCLPPLLEAAEMISTALAQGAGRAVG